MKFFLHFDRRQRSEGEDEIVQGQPRAANGQRLQRAAYGQRWDSYKVNKDFASELTHWMYERVNIIPLNEGSCEGERPQCQFDTDDAVVICGLEKKVSRNALISMSEKVQKIVFSYLSVCSDGSVQGKLPEMVLQSRIEELFAIRLRRMQRKLE